MRRRRRRRRSPGRVSDTDDGWCWSVLAIRRTHSTEGVLVCTVLYADCGYIEMFRVRQIIVCVYFCVCTQIRVGQT